MIRRLLLDPYQLGFMQRALVEVLLLGILGGVVGVHVLLRRMAFLTEALQHTVFPGIAIAFVAGESLLLGAIAAAAVTVVLLNVMTDGLRIEHDAALAVLIAGSFALGVVVVSRRTGYTADLSQLLFGRILDVDARQIVETAIIAAAALVVVAVFHRQFVLLAFDRAQAEALGFRVALLDLLLNAVVAASVVVAVRAVGTVLVVAFVVTPAASARLLGRSVGATIAIAVALASLLGWIGLGASFEASVHHGVRLAAGATVVVAFSLGFCVIGAVTWLARIGSRRGAVREVPA